MAKGAGGPSSEQLLELLKRAAAELTTARDEAARLQKELGKETKRREEAEGQANKERTVGGAHPKLREELEELQHMYQQTKTQLDQNRLELQNFRENLVNEVAAQREMKSAHERESNAHSATRAALETEQNAHLQTRALLEQQRNGAQSGADQELLDLRAAKEQAEAALAAAQEQADADLAQAREQAETELTQAREQAELELAQAREQLESDSAQGREQADSALTQARAELANEHQRIAELTESLATALAERDTLTARLEALEAARKTDREIEDAKVKDLEEKFSASAAREQQVVADSQAVLTQEKEKHQATAQKFLTEKQKARELEANLQEAKTRVAELESATMAAADAHAQDLEAREKTARALEQKLTQQLERLAAAHAVEISNLQAALSPLQQQVEATSQERFYVEKKYEELSRELQMTLEQRDEARRILENVQAERQRLERALQQR